MAPDEEAPLRLPKWPFYLGDALLVAAALAIAYLGEGRLAGWEVASCVLAVALGAGFFVLPHLLEFQARADAEREAERARRSPDGAADRRLRQLESAMATAEGAIRELRGARLALEEGMETVSAGVERRVESARAEQAETAAAVADVEARLRSLESAPPESARSAEAAGAAGEPGAGRSGERPARKPRRRKEPRSPLLDRAMRERGTPANSAVNRIIGGRAEESNASAEADESATGASGAEPRVSEPGPAYGGESADSGGAVGPAGPEGAEAETEPADTENRAETDPAEEDPAEEPTVTYAAASAPEPAPGEPEPAEASAKATPPAGGPADAADAAAPDAASDPAEGAEAPEAGDLFGGTVPRTPRSRRRVRAGDTVVIANVFVGIGNKPFLRGAGGGLSWERGVAMEFDGVGRWRWVAPKDSGGPFSVRVYRNDEEAETEGPHRIEAGERRELRPAF